MNETSHPVPARQPSDTAPPAAPSCCCAAKTHSAAVEVPQPLKDPVCGVTVTAQSVHSLQHDGKPVYFCGAGCKAKVAANPSKYLVPAASAPTSGLAAPEPGFAGAIYTCPMHPEVRQDHPGACPKCGMALNPRCPRSTKARALS